MSTPAPVLAPADAFAPADLHAAQLAAFADYVAGPVQMTADQWPSFLQRQGIDLARSRVAVLDGRIVALALACPRPDVARWRLAAMGASPAARGTGAAPALLDDFLDRARQAGAGFAELECFAANERALRLYRGRGFEDVWPLNGWKPGAGPAPAPAPAEPAIRTVAREAALAWLAEAGRAAAWLPFQGTARSLSAQARPLTGWRHGGAQLIFSVVEGTPTTIHSLVDLDPGLRDAEALALALRRTHPDAVAPALLPDAVGGDALRRAGFEREALNQVLLRRPL